MDELKAEKQRLIRDKIKNVTLIFLILTIVLLPSFMYFKMSTEENIAFREAKNIKLATTMLAVEYYGNGRSLYDPKSPDGMANGVKERLLTTTQNEGDIRILSYDENERCVVDFIYESGHSRITYHLNQDGSEDWKLDYIIYYDRYNSENNNVRRD
jgi:hypothetical protein